ncbi:hypothetical protein Mlg_1794 [Alkalilimnicola ehrlichii MLHE-1]|uniref:Uncharacterized protein n=1 Tax=Alkalilimnicola ehrlichii (strain ATCC BAA-1101 / DSM 17681 / MLHE-1) TaxID=187272 RepID=Q0A7P9_ALKEH|nr:hypothetical protein Mlg_1794 [Alkalilimnicola ehrlichii MLHE-1]
MDLIHRFNEGLYEELRISYKLVGCSKKMLDFARCLGSKLRLLLLLPAHGCRMKCHHKATKSYRCGGKSYFVSLRLSVEPQYQLARGKWLYTEHSLRPYV